MVSNRSFKNYVADRFYNELFAAIQSYTAENYEDLDLRLYRVQNIGGIELSDIEVKFVSINDLPDMKIEFDVAVEAELEARESDYYYDESETCRQWFILKCSGDLDPNLDDFAISSVNTYNFKNKQPKPMSDSLVPIINREQLESVATDFLRRHYPEAIKAPIAVEPQKLAEKMDLEVKMREITKDFSVFGQIYFHDCDTEFYDENSDEMVQTHVNARTIFVDPKAYFLRNLGSVNNTIVHECVHWDQHRKAFELERLYNENATHIKCQVIGGIKDNKVKSATDWMEWQANALTPRIQMPYTQAKVKAVELIRDYLRHFPGSKLIDIMESVIDEMASFFCVSRFAAKIRMVDLGYEEAIGTFTYIDGRYINAHSFKKGALLQNQTFSVSTRDAIAESLLNPELKVKVQTGSYIFVDSHFCINAPKYIGNDTEGKTCLTDYARHHVDECCLIFDLSVKKTANDYGKQFYTECVLFRDATSDIIFEAKFNSSKLNDEVDGRAKMVTAYNKELVEVMQSVPNSFSGTLKVLMKWKEITVEGLASDSCVSPKTIQRLRNDDEYETKLETIVALCLGMHLPPTASEYLIGKSKFSFIFSEKHLMYRFLLNSYYSHDIYDCNVLLAEQGLDPLTSAIEE